MQSLPATYAGHAFRSRLEARWYIFFEAMEEPCAYEPEAIDLGGFAYIPDYWLTVFRAWNEIKGEMVNDAAGHRMITKCTELALQSGRPAILSFGDPFDGRCALFRGNRLYTDCRWTVCPLCGRLAIGIREGQHSVFWCPEAKRHGGEPLAPGPLRLARRRLYDAAVKARSHRFGISRKAS